MRMLAVISTGRNGSTLLTRLLDGIPGCYHHPIDTNFIQAINDIATRGRVRQRVHNNTLAQPLSNLGQKIPSQKLYAYYASQIAQIEDKILPNLEQPLALSGDIKQVLTSSDGYSAKEFVPHYLRSLGAWIEDGIPPKSALFKSFESSYLVDYEALFPEMCFIHIVRDPVDTWASFKRTLMVRDKRPANYLGRDILISFLEYRLLPHLKAIRKKRDDPRHVLVRYEDVVVDPNGEISRICSELDCPPPVSALEQTVLGGRHFKKIPVNVSQPGVETPRTVVKNMSSKFDYDIVVTERERELILERTWEYMRPLGYFSEDTKPDHAQLTRAWMHLDRWDTVNYSGIMGIAAMAANIAYKRHYLLFARPDKSAADNG